MLSSTGKGSLSLQIIRAKLPEDSTPGVNDYLQAASSRQKSRANPARAFPDVLARLKEGRM